MAITTLGNSPSLIFFIVFIVYVFLCNVVDRNKRIIRITVSPYHGRIIVIRLIWFVSQFHSFTVSRGRNLKPMKLETV